MKDYIKIKIVLFVLFINEEIKQMKVKSNIYYKHIQIKVKTQTHKLNTHSLPFN